MAKKKAKQPAKNKAFTPEELEHKRVLAERYDLPINEEEVDVDEARKEWEAAEKKRKARLEADIERGRQERSGSDVRVGANPASVAAAIAAKARPVRKLTPEEIERKRQADIAQTRAVRYGQVVIVGSDKPSHTPDEIAEREAAWDKE